VRDLAAGPRRFVELQRVLPGISTEQLRSRLNRMVADGMLTRKRYREVPPRVDYELTERASELMPILAELARWGYEWAWGPPRASENVDIGAIFRLAPGLVSPDGAQGTIEFTINDGKQDGEAATFTFTLTGDRVAVSEQPADNPDARARGDVADWVSAFSTERDRSRLEIRGDEKLVDRLLDGLALTTARARSHASAA
jgi:DNA-binding HxlR family transcriptional regulator